MQDWLCLIETIPIPRQYQPELLLNGTEVGYFSTVKQEINDVPVNDAVL